MSVKEAFPPLFLVVNTFTLFNLTWLVIQDFLRNTPLGEMLTVSASYYTAVIISSFVGVTLLRIILRKRDVLFRVTLAGASLYVLSAFIITENLIVTAFILGASFGIIIPTCLTFFADYSKIDGRGRLGGIMFFLIQFFTVIIYALASMFNAVPALLTLAGWRIVGATSILFYGPFTGASEGVKAHSKKVMVKDRLFLLYFIPWFMFCLVNFVEVPLLEQYFGQEKFTIYMLVAMVIAGISAFLGGLICDLRGRRIASIAGFILLGISYAVLNIFPDAGMAEVLFMIVEGVAWGILYVTFIFVIWGDVSEGKVREAYYFLGGVPFLLSGLIQAVTQQFVKVIPIYSSFSLASFFLFLAVVPLLYASETLPEKKLKERELRSYIEKAKRFREKFTKG
ncbi:MAG: hypothetical protein QXK18_05140 [Candidatus Bathyarchaeia archaeon]